MSTINNQQLLSSIINNLERRLLTTRSSNEKARTTPGPDRDSHQEDYGTILVPPVGLGVGFRRLTTEPNPTEGTRIDPYKALLSELKVLDSKRWPSNKSVGYGEPEIEKLCT
ncbi:hypothetical protein AVEN_143736-1 [Araneus ventricosus]|uniref:Uncharacterized protein n=1 Tax=Araneus ventricosus TaxID=182803 RepID=A0A4Y2APN1_ARAVE|nr:hypothetical protein AVEN_143736-1 [Araneus ventricosus]